MGDKLTNSSTVNAAKMIQLEELDPHSEGGGMLLGARLDLIKGAKVRLQVSVGGAEITVKDLLALRSDATIRLDKVVEDPIDLLLEGKVIATGTLVAIDDNFGIRITRIAQES